MVLPAVLVPGFREQAAALHYAHLFYSSADEDGGARRDAGGLNFPGDEEPTLLDFLYYSFVVGMTSQVSDAQAIGSAMRWTTFVHSVTSFFVNSVLVALAVNAAASFWR